MSGSVALPLPALACPICGWAMTNEAPPSGDRVRAAGTYRECLRRCSACKVGYSNAQTKPTLIHADPVGNVPLEVRTGVLRVLSEAINIHNRPNKIKRFSYSTSEDAVTWTVFSFLSQHRRDVLPRLVQTLFGIPPSEGVNVLLWGVPITPGTQADAVQLALLRVTDALGEHPRSPSEPDVILDCGGAGLVVIEVKYLSANDQRTHANWPHYVQDAGAFANRAAAQSSGLYELVRNWRIAHDLAAGRPFAVANLAPASTLAATPNMEQFKASLNSSPERRFVPLTWSGFLTSMTAECEGLPPWFDSYLQDRRLP